MGSSRKLHARLFRCGFSAWLSSRCGNTAGQTRPRNRRTRFTGNQRKPPERVDVARLSQRVDDSAFCFGPDRILGRVDHRRLNGRISCTRGMPATISRLLRTQNCLPRPSPLQRSDRSTRANNISTTGTLDANGVLNGDLVLTGRGDANLSIGSFRTRKKSNETGPPKKRSPDWPMPSWQAV